MTHPLIVKRLEELVPGKQYLKFKDVKEYGTVYLGPYEKLNWDGYSIWIDGYLCGRVVGGQIVVCFVPRPGTVYTKQVPFSFASPFIAPGEDEMASLREQVRSLSGDVEALRRLMDKRGQLLDARSRRISAVETALDNAGLSSGTQAQVNCIESDLADLKKRVPENTKRVLEILAEVTYHHQEMQHKEGGAPCHQCLWDAKQVKGLLGLEAFSSAGKETE